ncbi:MAG: AAA family ATPase [Planctomycetota bacterium]
MTSVDMEALEARVGEAGAFLGRVADEVERVVVGQRELVESLLLGLLADGHVLLEGLPGLAKSLTVSTLASALGCSHRRIQFTPDLLPSDLLGTQVFQPASGTWSVREGPVFAQIVLADEINRAPAKVQSALLEAMQERTVTLAGETHVLPSPFLVLATQNPVELEGTYPLPEAQIDRFLFKVVVTYPSREAEHQVLRRMMDVTRVPKASPVATPDDVLAARRVLDEVYVDDRLLTYVTDLLVASRDPTSAGLPDLKPLILYGASPRAGIALVRAARARAFLDGRAYVSPQDVKSVGLEVLRHRVLTTYEAEAEGVTGEDVVTRLFDHVPIP